MYSEKVGHIYVQKAKLIFKDQYGQPINEETEVQDIGTPLNYTDALGSKFAPDYCFSGFFRKVDHDSKNEFILSKEGPDIIFVTGVPRNYPSLDPFRLRGSLFSSYWQDTVKGVLFQVMKKVPVFIGTSKNQSILQL